MGLMDNGYKRFWRDYVVQHKAILLLVIVLMTISAAVSGAYAKFVQILIEAMEAGDLDFLYIAPLLIVGLTCIKALAFFYQIYFSARALGQAEADLQDAMYTRLVHSDLAHLQTEAPASLAARFSADVTTVRGSAEAILNGLSNLFIVLATFGMMLSINWTMTIGLILIFLISVWPVYWIGQVVRRVSRQVMEQIARMTADVNEGLSGIRLVRTYGLEQRLTGTAHEVFDTLRAQKIRQKTWTAGVEPVMEVMGGLALAGLLGLVAWQMGQGRGSLADFIALLTGLAVASTPARRLGATFTASQLGAAALERIFGLLDREDTILESGVAQSIDKAKGALAFDAVSFAYPDGTQALHDFTLNIAPGQKVAFVGRSGAGKSTIFNLLPRLYDPTRGVVRLDGVALTEYRLKDLRDQIAVVSQDSVLMTGTVAENIGFGRRDADRDAIIAAAKAAEAHGFIEALSNGYDTHVHPSEASFSGGERQRLSIARALLRDAPLLILDEPTSALDAKSEAVIREALDRLAEGRTTLVIAHRLSTIRDADVIVVMDQGRIVDQGSHEDLLARDGIYAELHALQFGAG